MSMQERAANIGVVATVLRIAIVTAVLFAIPAIALMVLRYLPRTALTPADATARRDWASQRGPLIYYQGMTLAVSLEHCLRTTGRATSAEELLGRSCDVPRRSWYGAGVEAMAALGAYQPDDDGWRWDITTGADARLVVFPDPLVDQPGPVFDVQPYGILRRADRNSPGFHTDSFLPSMAATLECLARRGDALRTRGKWNGEGATLPALLAAPDRTEEECGLVQIEDRPERPDALWLLRISGEGLPWPHRIEFRPVSAGRATPYTISFFSDGVGYLVDDDGAWHMRAGAPATATDPAPPRCLVDLSVPCD